VCSYSHMAHKKTPTTDPLLLERRTPLGEGCTENTKASSALQLSHRFSPHDLILLLQIFTCLLSLNSDLNSAEMCSPEE